MRRDRAEFRSGDRVSYVRKTKGLLRGTGVRVSGVVLELTPRGMMRVQLDGGSVITTSRYNLELST